MTLGKASIAVVTGAASGIGRALATRLAREGITGIAISDVNEAGLAETAKMAEPFGIPVSTHIIDVSDLDQMMRFADDVLAKHGGVTHLINNAGVGLAVRRPAGFPRSRSDPGTYRRPIPLSGLERDVHAHRRRFRDRSR